MQKRYRRSYNIPRASTSLYINTGQRAERQQQQFLDVLRRSDRQRRVQLRRDSNAARRPVRVRAFSDFCGNKRLRASSTYHIFTSTSRPGPRLTRRTRSTSSLRRACQTGQSGLATSRCCWYRRARTSCMDTSKKKRKVHAGACMH